MLIIFQSMLWMLFGVIVYREKIVNADTPKLLGRALYWLGVPLQIFFLARRSNFEQIVWLPPVVTISVLLLGLILALLVLRIFERLFFRDRFKFLLPSYKTSHRDMPLSGGAFFKTGLSHSTGCRFDKQNRQDIVAKKRSTVNKSKILAKLSRSTAKSIFTAKTIGQFLLPRTRNGTGSFILASILGNTGFIGLALIPPLVSQDYWSWIVLYGVVHNILGSYGLGVMVADYYSYSANQEKNSWWDWLQKLLLLPSLWAFIYGYTSRDLPLPNLIEVIISQGVLFVVPGAFILIGMQLSKLQQWRNLQAGIFPTLIKMLILPGITGLLLTCFGIEGDKRLVLVLMSSMPTAFASIILAEAYNLDRRIAASSILLSTLLLPIILLLWLTIF